MESMTAWSVTIGTYLVTLTFVTLVIMQRKQPVAAIAWILAILLLPFVGLALYLWFGYARIERRIRKRTKSTKEIASILETMEQQNDAYKDILEMFESAAQRELAAITKKNALPITHGNAVSLLTKPEDLFLELAEAIQNARHSIHLEFYIFRADETGLRIRDLLIEASRRGVEVRLLVDGVGSWMIGRRFSHPLRKVGAKFAHFLPVTPFGRPWHWNLRNHRKIAIIDGAIGMIGSANIGNEYRVRRGTKDDYYDTQILCRGPVVRQLQELFATDWLFATNENVGEESYFPRCKHQGNVAAHIVPSGPDTKHPVLEEMICAAIHAAQTSVRIMTPYFIPDQALIIALRTAALRGVSVEIMTPRHAPVLHERLITIATRSYYEDLLEAGVRIREYLPGFLHAKGIIVDDAWASIGTANMDIRSFSLNFEVNINLYSQETIRTLSERYREHAALCEDIVLAEFAKRPFHKKLLENTLRLFSPVL